MTKTYFVGDLWRIDAAITDPITGAAVDPSSLEVKVKKPDGTETTVAPTKTAMGADHVVVALTLPGTWQATWVSPTGTYQGVEEISVSVKRAPGV